MSYQIPDTHSFREKNFLTFIGGKRGGAEPRDIIHPVTQEPLSRSKGRNCICSWTSSLLNLCLAPAGLPNCLVSPGVAGSTFDHNPSFLLGSSSSCIPVKGKETEMGSQCYPKPHNSCLSNRIYLKQCINHLIYLYFGLQLHLEAYICIGDTGTGHTNFTSRGAQVQLALETTGIY